MLRRLAKTGISCALHWTGAERVIGTSNGARNLPWVLAYHRVVEDCTASAEDYMPAMLISRRMLERHLDWLGRRYRFLSLDELGAHLESGEPFSKPVLALTFDDGYADVYHHAFPLLKRKGIPAGLFVVTDLIGTDRLQVYDKLFLLLKRAFSRWDYSPHPLARLLTDMKGRLLHKDSIQAIAFDPFTAMRDLMTALSQAEIHCVIEALEAQVPIDEGAFKDLHSLTWEMVSEMRHAGMSIGSHTRTHALLPNESYERVQDETAHSRRVLEQRLGTPIRHFTYPDGQFNAATVRSVADAGYRFAYAACPHRNPVYPLLAIPRKFLWENSCMDALGHFSPSIMSCLVHGVFDAFAPCHPHQDWASESPQSPTPAVTGHWAHS